MPYDAAQVPSARRPSMSPAAFRSRLSGGPTPFATETGASPGCAVYISDGRATRRLLPEHVQRRADSMRLWTANGSDACNARIVGTAITGILRHA